MLLLAACGLAFATDVLIPDATPLSLTDFDVAARLQADIVAEVGKGTFDVDAGEELRRWAGRDADGCYDDAACPANLWGRTDARVALVMAVGAVGDRIVVEVRFFARGVAQPVRVVKDEIPRGTEAVFAKDLAFTTSEVLAGLPRGPGPEIWGAPATPATPPVAEVDEAQQAAEAEARRKAEEDAARRAEAAALAEAKRKAAEAARREVEAGERAEAERAAKEQAEAERVAKEQATAERVAKEQATPERVAKEQATPERGAKDRADVAPRSATREPPPTRRGEPDGRAVHLLVEAAVGAGLGDTDRGYGAWIHIEPDGDAWTSTAASTWEGSGHGAGGGAGLAAWGAVTARPVRWVDLSVAVGVQGGRTYVDAGWECPSCATTSGAVRVPAAQLWTLWIQPKVRLAPLPDGRIRPYVLGGVDLAVYPSLTVDSATVVFPRASGGATLGVAAGLGASVALTDLLSVFVELPVSLTLSPQWRSYDSDRVDTRPATLDVLGGLARPVAGVAIGW